MKFGDGVERVVIATPQFPSSYPTNSICHWNFESSAPAYKIEIEVIFWEVLFISREHNKT